MRKKPQKPIQVKCDYCKNLFIKHVCHLKHRNFCNKECYRKHLLGKKFSTFTRKKMSLAQAGEKSNTWKGGVSRGYKRGYKREQYKRWRIAVFERDFYTCQVCQQVGGYLTSHHIKSFAKYPKLRYVVSNGVTLCEGCHALVDNYYRRFYKGGD